MAVRRGRFIAFEGGEGAGKSTHCRLLADALAARGIDAVVTREPGGTPGAEAVRSLLLTRVGEGWSPRAEALLFAAARADHVEKLIRPALEAGKWVICDRFVDSSRAYQGGGGGLADEDLLELHRIGSHGLLPDCTVLMEIASGIAAERLSRRDSDGPDRIEAQPSDYHARVAAAFRALAEAEPDRYVRIDGDGTREDVHGRIIVALSKRFPDLQ